MSHSKQIKERRPRSTSLGVSTLVPYAGEQGMADHGAIWTCSNSIFRYQSQHDTVIPPLKPIGQTFVKVDNQAKVVATKITIDSRSPAVS